MQLPIYLDYMATTPVDPRVAAKMQQYLTLDGIFGNPSSRHSYGNAAYEAVTNASKQVAGLINAPSKSIVWTSGATEANNLALKGAANFYKRQGNHIITLKTEHKAVLDPCKYLETQGFKVTYLTPEKDGLLDLNKLEASIQRDTILVSCMQVNNEIGVIQDIAAIGAMTRKRGILLHVDAAQSAGKIPIDVEKMQIDLISFAAHKIYGPKGIGALYVRQQPRLHLEPQIHGGDQQNGLRSGTLATHQIVGMGEAFAIAQQEMAAENERILTLREKFWRAIEPLGNIQLNGSEQQRVPGNLNLSFVGIDNEILLAAIPDLAVSTAAACKKAALTPSYVLQAIGVSNDIALNTIRISFGRFTTEEEVNYAIRHLSKAIKQLRE